MMLVGLLCAMTTLGTPTVERFFGGAQGAFSMEFDDSMDSQVKNLLPLLARHQAVATFFVCPGVGHYAENRTVWEKSLVAAGHELADHTMTHSDCPNAAKASVEIGEAAKIIERINGRPRIVPFGLPGGTKWTVPEPDLNRIYRANRLFKPRREAMFMNGSGDPDITAIPRRAIAQKRWIEMLMHGVGGEWLTTSIADIEKLLDFVDAHRGDLWTCRTGDAWRYEQERDSVAKVTAKVIDATHVEVAIECDPKKVETFGAPFASLYDQPLTVRIPRTGQKDVLVSVVPDGKAHRFQVE